MNGEYWDNKEKNKKVNGDQKNENIVCIVQIYQTTYFYVLLTSNLCLWFTFFSVSGFRVIAEPLFLPKSLEALAK